MKKPLAVVVLSIAAVAGCGGGGGSGGPSAYSFAQQACQTSGAAAASLASRAAKLDPKYDQLAADEAALAANIAAQQPGAVPSTDAGFGDLAGVTGQSGVGQGSSYQVLKDCADMAKTLLPGQ